MAGRNGGWAAVTGFAVMFSAGAAPAQSNPPTALERARAMQAIADQKADAAVREMVVDAEKVAAASPTVAVQRLKRALLSLDLSADIGAAKREELAKSIKDRIAAIENRAAPAAALDPKLAQQKEATRKLLDAYVQETKAVREGVAAVEKAYAANNTPAANKTIAELSQKYPTNPAVLALTTTGPFGDRADEAKRLAVEQDKRIVVAMNQVQESALPGVRDVEFPKDWKERAGKRNDGIEIGPEETAILKALETQVRTGMKDSPFLETVQQLSNLIGKEIYLDRKSLEEAGLDVQRPVTMPGNVPARTALRAVLQSQGLTFVIKEKIIQVVTLEKAQTLQVTRAYYLGELVQGVNPLPGGAPVWGPTADYQQSMANGKLIVESITQSIDPLIWKDRGGPATILFHYPSLSIIVRAPTEVHAGFRGKLSGR
ncbi:MAG: hypothetical protein ACRC7O_04815 [Fimbriiglobus sp.]